MSPDYLHKTRGSLREVPHTNEMLGGARTMEGTRYADKTASIVVRVALNRYLVDIDSGTS